MNQLTEYRHIQSIYSEFFQSIRVIQDEEEPTKTNSNKDNDISLAITTHENECFNISVNVNGWSMSDKESVHYETFEALAMKISPTFQLKFHQQLLSKLQSDLIQKSDKI